ncbi:MAG: sialate O-acetylesterase [Bacteroidales bacterium]|nr:sialate O-acetylesterase [Bacteroidales bacterium]
MKIFKLNIRIPVIFCLLILTTKTFSQDQNFHIYLCFGQSNMEGQGKIEAQDKAVDSRFQVMQALDCSNIGRTKGKWYPAVPPLCQCYSGLSPADYFGKTMVANLPDSIKIGIINVAIGGCDIRLFDKDIYQDYDSTYTESWFTDKIKSYEGNPYKYLIDLANLAQQDGVIKGILLHQGETNTGNTQWPSYVKTIYNNMLIDLSLDPESVPLLAGEVLSADGNCCSSMNQIINRLPDTIPTAYVISSNGCTGQDNAHFNSEGYRILGRRYAEKMLSLMGYEISTSFDEISASKGYALEQNYPNPFSNKTNISFKIPDSAYVSLKVFNMQGTEVMELAGKGFSAGTHMVEFCKEKHPAGTYFYTIKVDQYVATRKLIIQTE